MTLDELDKVRPDADIILAGRDGEQVMFLVVRPATTIHKLMPQFAATPGVAWATHDRRASLDFLTVVFAPVGAVDPWSDVLEAVTALVASKIGQQPIVFRWGSGDDQV